MKLVVITGPQAVGKMTVGRELADMTGLMLFHNHMTIDLVSNFFSYGSPQGKRLVHLFRREIFEEVAKSDLPGLIFTYLWAFDLPSDGEYIDQIEALFAAGGGETYYVELEAALEARLERNTSPYRLEQKPTKRDVDWSRRDLIDTAQRHRLNSQPGEIAKPHYVRIDNTNLSAREAALRICEAFGL